jgi:predicted Rossmann fold flavoprotein
VATGGLSIPRMGATTFAHELAQRFGVPVTETRPGLVPLMFDGDDLAFCSALSGLSIDAVVRCNGQSFAEAVLFTHRGLSGPAILQISSYWREGDAIEIDVVPDQEDIEFLTEAAVNGWGLARALEGILPRRFAQAWSQRYGPRTTLDRMFERDLEGLAGRLHAWQVTPSGTEGFAKAEVTVGGIDTTALDSRTMACREVPNLYFIGECVDVTGWLGGYNFQWAWASAHAAAMAV